MFIRTHPGTHAQEAPWFDYSNEAWVVKGAYVSCGHSYSCDCYGRKHEGQAPSMKIRRLHEEFERDRVGAGSN